MTLTVCIPIYNQDVTGLVYALLKQTKLTKGCVNIVVLDDHSETAFHQINSVLSKDVSYIRLDSNIGRSKIRNKFLEYTDSDYLLFIDCDSTIVDDRYILAIKSIWSSINHLLLLAQAYIKRNNLNDYIS